MGSSVKNQENYFIFVYRADTGILCTVLKALCRKKVKKQATQNGYNALQ